MYEIIFLKKNNKISWAKQSKKIKKDSQVGIKCHGYDLYLFYSWKGGLWVGLSFSTGIHAAWNKDWVCWGRNFVRRSEDIFLSWFHYLRNLLPLFHIWYNCVNDHRRQRAIMLRHLHTIYMQLVTLEVLKFFPDLGNYNNNIFSRNITT